MVDYTHITCRPTLESGVSFNGHIVLVSGLDNNDLIQTVLLANTEPNTLEHDCISVQLQPSFWYWLETHLSNDLQNIGIMRYTSKGVKDPYIQWLINQLLCIH